MSRQPLIIFLSYKEDKSLLFTKNRLPLLSLLVQPMSLVYVLKKRKSKDRIETGVVLCPGKGTNEGFVKTGFPSQRQSNIDPTSSRLCE